MVYLDLLNQRAMLDYLEKLPMSKPESFDLHKEAIRKTVGRVKDFHNAFTIAMEKLFLELDPKYEITNCIKRYSDSVILYLPLEIFSNPSYSVLLLDGLCDFMFCTLSAGLPCRGAVEFGKAVENKYILTKNTI